MTIRQALKECNPNALTIDGHDEALIGIGGAYNQMLAVYSETKLLEGLEARGLTHAEAVEYLEFNIRGCYSGEHTPIIVWDGYQK